MSGGHFFLDTHQIGHAMEREWQDEEINELFYCAKLQEKCDELKGELVG